MIDFRDKIFIGADSRKSLFDVTMDKNAKAVIIFVHGYKGFKDWGCWNLVHDYFVNAGFGFVKFNMSHNGGTIQNKIDFPDPDAFGRNTYSKELYDLDVIVKETKRMLKDELNHTVPIFLLGHSRGGAVVLLYSAQHDAISKVVSWAGVSDFESRFPKGEELDFWREDGVRYVENMRTKQNLPHYYSFYEDFLQNKENLNIEKWARKINIPFLQIHGDMDQSVSIHEGSDLALWTQTKLEIIKGADHTFGANHPYHNKEIPEDMKEALELTLRFFSVD